jgi:hypothetical protein
MAYKSNKSRIVKVWKYERENTCTKELYWVKHINNVVKVFSGKSQDFAYLNYHEQCLGVQYL